MIADHGYNRGIGDGRPVRRAAAGGGGRARRGRQFHFLQFGRIEFPLFRMQSRLPRSGRAR